MTGWISSPRPSDLALSRRRCCRSSVFVMLAGLLLVGLANHRHDQRHGRHVSIGEAAHLLCRSAQRPGGIQEDLGVLVEIILVHWRPGLGRPPKTLPTAETW